MTVIRPAMPVWSAGRIKIRPAKPAPAPALLGLYRISGYINDLIDIQIVKVQSGVNRHDIFGGGIEFFSQFPYGILGLDDVLKYFRSLI
jgi:hypothetical protein